MGESVKTPKKRTPAESAALMDWLVDWGRQSDEEEEAPMVSNKSLDRKTDNTPTKKTQKRTPAESAALMDWLVDWGRQSDEEEEPVTSGKKSLVGYAAKGRGQPCQQGETTKTGCIAAPKVAPSPYGREGGEAAINPDYAVEAVKDTFTQGIAVAQQTLQHYKKELDKVTDVPLLREVKAASAWLSDKTLKFAGVLQKRYGLKGAAMILASGQALGWGVFAAGTAMGVPAWVPGGSIIFSLPGVAVAEVAVRVSRALKSGQKSLEELTPEQAGQLFAQFATGLGNEYVAYLLNRGLIDGADVEKARWQASRKGLPPMGVTNEDPDIDPSAEGLAGDDIEEEEGFGGYDDLSPHSGGPPLEKPKVAPSPFRSEVWHKSVGDYFSKGIVRGIDRLGRRYCMNMGRRIDCGALPKRTAKGRHNAAGVPPTSGGYADGGHANVAGTLGVGEEGEEGHPGAGHGNFLPNVSLGFDDDAPIEVASGDGWEFIGQWVAGLKDTPELTALFSQGRSENLEQLGTDLTTAEESAEPNVKEILKHIHELIQDNSGADVVEVFNGQPTAPTPPQVASEPQG